MHRVVGVLSHVARLGALALPALLLVAGGALAADDTEPPSGTFSVNGGVTAVNSTSITLNVPATDNVGVVSVVVSVKGVYSEPIPYAETIPWTLPDDGDGTYVMQVEWLDAAGNGWWSDGIDLVLDRVAPAIASVSLTGDPDLAAGTYPIAVPTTGEPLAFARFSSNGTTWGAPMAWASPVWWPILDPAYGGSSRLGARKVYVQGGDAAGNWSNTKTLTTNAIADATIDVSPDAPRTGHTITLTPTWPSPATFPAGTICMWEVEWGDDSSLYFGDRDSTFGFFAVQGNVGGGFCGPLSFTLPWMQYPQVLVHYRIDLPNDDGGVDAWIGGSPDEEAIVPIIDGTSRKITSANLPLIYVLPEDYILVVGQPTTYRAYTVGGATFDSADTWFADYGDNPIQQTGGSSFTFVPRRTGYVTVCFNSDTTEVMYWSACYDPAAKYPDTSRPNTTVPAVRIGTGGVGMAMPATVSWKGSDTGWGIDHYTLQRSKDGGTWTTVLSGKSATWSGSLALGHDYRFRVRATDKAGNVGYWDVAPTVRARVTEDSSSSITYGAAWGTVADPTARGASLHETGTAGSAARYTFVGSDIAWVAERGPGHGRAFVYLDGTLVATVDLNASVDAPARIVFRRHLGAVATHTVRIVVEGTTDRPTVDIDGFVRLR